MNLRTLLLATAMAVSFASPVLAQAVAELEGKVIGLSRTTGQNGTLKMFNTTVTLNSGTTYSTPTRDGLTLGQIINCNKERMPGVDANPLGTFLGGTAIVTGTSSAASGVVAQTVFLEPAENVLLGRVTSVPNADGTGSLSIEGTSVVLIGKKMGGQIPKPVAGETEIFNACIPGKGVINGFFIEIPASALEKNTEAAAEGWWGNDGRFYAFLIEGEGTVEKQTLDVAILRASCRNRGGARGLEISIRGGVAAPANATGTVDFGVMTGTTFTNYNIPTAVVPDLVDPRYGTFDIDENVTGSAATTGCPAELTVRYSPDKPLRTVTATAVSENR